MEKLLLFGALAFGLHAFGQVPSYVPANGLLSFWGFNNNTNDDSGNGNNGTNNGASFVNDRFGTSNSALSFNGSNSFVAVNSDPEWDFGTDEFSVSTWVLYTDSLQTGNVIRYDNCLGSAGLWYLRVNQEGVVHRNYDQSHSSPMYLTPDTFMADSSWHHIVVTRDISSGILSYYLDGVVVDTTLDNSNNIIASVSASLSIGRCGSYNGEYFAGLIDDIGIWGRALSACEVEDLYNAQLNSTIFTATQNGTQLTADQSGATYQWLDCDNNYAVINGETNQSYTPAVTGNYAVEVNMNGCVDTSACFLVDYTGIEELLQTEKELVKIVDFMGRETEYKPNTPLIFIYSDGTRERVMKLEE